MMIRVVVVVVKMVGNVVVVIVVVVVVVVVVIVVSASRERRRADVTFLKCARLYSLTLSHMTSRRGAPTAMAPIVHDEQRTSSIEATSTNCSFVCLSRERFVCCSTAQSI